MAEFAYQDLLPLGADDTPYRLLTADYVSTFEAGGRRFLQVDPEALTLLTKTGDVRDRAPPAARPPRAAARRSSTTPRRRPTTVFVATRAAEERVHRGGRHPPVVPGHRHRDREGQEGRARAHRRRRPRGDRPRASSRPTPRTTCATRRWRRSPCTRRRTPARTCRPRSRSRRSTATRTSSCSWPRAAARPTRACCSRRRRRCSTPTSLMRWLDEKLRTLGTAACPPYHLALVIGGTSAEQTLKTAKLASARYLDTLPGDRQRARPRLPRRRARAAGAEAHAGVRHRRAVRRQVLLPRRARDPAAAPRRVVPGRARGVVLGRPPVARQDHRRRRVPRAARDRSREVPPRRHRRRTSTATRSCASTSPSRWRDPRDAVAAIR